MLLPDKLAEYIVSRPGAFIFLHRASPDIFNFFDRFYRHIFTWAIDRIQDFDSEKLEAFQLKRLKTLLSHSARNVPFWKKACEDMNLVPENIVNLEDLRVLPIMKRADINNNRDYCDERPVEKFVFNTSGSTGQPMNYVFNLAGSRSQTVGLYYLSKFVGLPVNLRTLRLIIAHERYIYFGVHINTIVGDIRKKEERQNLYNFFESFKPEMFFGWPSLLERLMNFLKEDGFKYSPRLIFVGGEYLSARLQRDLEDFFKCPVFVEYGSAELGIMAQECVKKNGFHINTQKFIIEIVDDFGNLQARSKPGRILVTLFDNKPMPFIRYDTGDVGYIIDEPCGCGKKTPRIFFEGRIMHMLLLPDNTKYPLIELMKLLDKYYSHLIKKYQFIQESLSRLTLRIVPTDQFAQHHRLILTQALLDTLKQSAPLDINIEAVASIEDPPGGKAQIFISKIR